MKLSERIALLRRALRTRPREEQIGSVVLRPGDTMTISGRLGGDVVHVEVLRVEEDRVTLYGRVEYRN